MINTKYARAAEVGLISAVNGYLHFALLSETNHTRDVRLRMPWPLARHLAADDSADFNLASGIEDAVERSFRDDPEVRDD